MADRGVPLSRAMWLMKAVFLQVTTRPGGITRIVVERWTQSLVAFVKDSLKKEAFRRLLYGARLLSHCFHENLLHRPTLYTKLMDNTVVLKPNFLPPWFVLVAEYLPSMLATIGVRRQSSQSQSQQDRERQGVERQFFEMLKKTLPKMSQDTPFARFMKQFLVEIQYRTMGSPRQPVVCSGSPMTPLLQLQSQAAEPLLEVERRGVSAVEVIGLLDDFENTDDVAGLVDALKATGANWDNAGLLVPVVCEWACTSLRAHVPYRHMLAETILAEMSSAMPCTDEPALQPYLTGFLESFACSSPQELTAVAVLMGALMRRGLFSHDLFTRRLIGRGNQRYLLHMPVYSVAGTDNLQHLRNQRREALLCVGGDVASACLQNNARSSARSAMMESLVGALRRLLEASAEVPAETLRALSTLPVYERFQIAEMFASSFMSSACTCPRHCSSAAAATPLRERESEEPAAAAAGGGLCLCRCTEQQLAALLSVAEAAGDYPCVLDVLLCALSAESRASRPAVGVGAVRASAQWVDAFVRSHRLQSLVDALSSTSSTKLKILVRKPIAEIVGASRAGLAAIEALCARVPSLARVGAQIAAESASSSPSAAQPTGSPTYSGLPEPASVAALERMCAGRAPTRKVGETLAALLGSEATSARALAAVHATPSSRRAPGPRRRPARAAGGPRGR
eukprot:m51a1_g12876 hypothetical protein (682) ;mRNA; r:116-3165